MGRCVLARPGGIHPGSTPRYLLSVNVDSSRTPPWCVGCVNPRGSINARLSLLRNLHMISWCIGPLLSFSIFVFSFLLFFVLTCHVLFVLGSARYFSLFHLSCRSIWDAARVVIFYGRELVGWAKGTVARSTGGDAAEGAAADGIADLALPLLALPLGALRMGALLLGALPPEVLFPKPLPLGALLPRAHSSHILLCKFRLDRPPTGSLLSSLGGGWACSRTWPDHPSFLPASTVPPAFAVEKSSSAGEWACSRALPAHSNYLPASAVPAAFAVKESREEPVC